MSNTTTTTRTRRPRPKLVTLTDAAAERVREILDERGEGYLRVGVTNGGCAGMEYVMEIVVDAKAVLFILGSVVDYEIDVMSSKFTFKNPNQTDACGCGESVTIVPFATE